MSLVVGGRVQGFAWEPGKNAGYRAGRSLLKQCTCHITAGRCVNDRSVIIGQGLANGYVPRDPSCGPGATQNAEYDAVTFGCCEWNHVCTSLEVEAVDMGVVFTDYQIDKIGLWVAAGIQLGIRDVHLVPVGGGRFPLGSDLRGFVDHRYLQQRACDQHGDGWNQWAQIRAAADRYLGGGSPTPTFTEDNEMGNVIVDPDGNAHVFWITSPTTVEERWGAPGSPARATHNFGKEYPLKKGGQVSIARNPSKPADYIVSLERDDGSTRTLARVGGKWVAE